MPPKSAIKVSAIQYSAALAGLVWGWAADIYLRRPQPHLFPFIGFHFFGKAGAFAALLLGLAWLGTLFRRRSPGRSKLAPWICLSLAIYAAYLLYSDLPDAFSGEELVWWLLALLPFLMAIGHLVRSRAWLGVAGAALFYATAVALLTIDTRCPMAPYGFWF
jgi:hypothetical protein